MYQLHVMLNDHELKHFTNQVRVSGLSRSAFIRALILNKTIQARPPNEYADLLRELSAIGNNINQIARVANGNQYISSAQIEKIMEMQGEIWRRVKGL